MDEAAKYWGDRRITPFYYGDSTQTQTIIKAIAEFDPITVFEFGCGTGRNLHFIKKQISTVLDVVGLDINRNAVQGGRKAYPDVQLLCGSHKSIWFKLLPRDRFGVSFTVSALGHLSNRDDVIDVINRLVYLSHTAVILLEPWCGREGLVFPDYTRVLHSYSWDYDSILNGQSGIEVVHTRKIMLSSTMEGVRSLHKYYVMWVCEKVCRDEL